MKLQRSKVTCGPLAIVNAARALGIKLTERRVRAHTGTTKKDGTLEHGMKNALERLGLYGGEMDLMSDDSFDALYAAVQGCPVILCVDNLSHWVVAIGVAGPRIITFDSENTPENRAECGVDVWDSKGILDWWAHDKRCYGILVRPDSL